MCALFAAVGLEMERGEWVEKPLADAAKRATAALQRKIMMVGVSPLQYIYMYNMTSKRQSSSFNASCLIRQLFNSELPCSDSVAV